MGLADIFSLKGGLEKLIISAFKDPDFSEPVDEGQYSVMYNPTTYSQEYKSKWITKSDTQGNGDKVMEFRTLEAESVSFEFMFDATGASPAAEDQPGVVSAAKLIADDEHVDGAIKAFFDLTHNVQGETHKPNYIKINWGPFEFSGVLGSATVNYKLFNSGGLPIRATIQATFDQSLSEREKAVTPPLNSPDLTHVRVVKDGDTLPLMAKRIYGDDSFYLELAKVNNLTNFRKLRVGQKLKLPPIDKKVNNG
ncbi:MAG: LysM peptidoglycan-binding domain-containing protein [Bacteroidota bacterium]